MKKLYFLPLFVFCFVSLIADVFAQNETWTLNVPPRGRNVNAVEMFSQFNIAIAGGNPTNDSIRYFAKTSNGGDFWDFIDQPLNPMINDLTFTAENIAVMVGDAGEILKTYDGGTNWEMLPIPSNVSTRSFNAVHFFNTETGIVVGGNLNNDAITTILRTTNGGNEWSIISDNQGAMLNEIDFANANTGIAVGNNGLVLKTTDGGLNWTAISNIPGGAASRNYNDVAVIDDQTYIIVGGNLTNDSIQTIIKTTDGGSNWAIIKDNPSPMLNGVHFYNNTNGYAVGNNGTVIKTIDAGENWISLALPDVNEDYTFNTVQFIDEETGIVAGNFGAVFIAADTNVSAPILPIVNTFSADNITSNSATIGGNVNAQNTNTTVYFEFGTSQNYDNVFSPDQDTFTDSIFHNISLLVNGLQPETNYHYRIVAFNDNDTVYGANQQFTTIEVRPEVETENGVLLDDDRLVLMGKANAQNNNLNVLFQFGETTSYGEELIPTESTFSDDTYNDVLYVIDEDLNENIYHFRLIGIYNNDTVFGEDKQVFIGNSSIPNFNFEFWDTLEYSTPDTWLTIGQVSEVSDATDGNSAVLLQSGIDIYNPQDEDEPGVILKGSIGDEGPIGGIPFTERPDTLSFSAKYDIGASDAALVLLFFKKDGNIFSQHIFQITGSSNDEFETLKFKIDYQSAETPDSIILGFTSSNFMLEEIDLSNTIVIDNVQFIGANNQVSNNSFENWSNYEFTRLSNWASEVTRGNEGYITSATPSNDAFYGNLAAKLENQSTFDLQAAISTGSLNDSQIPSFAVNYQHKQLTGFYKANLDNDTAYINISMFKAGEQIGYGEYLFLENQDDYNPFLIDINYDQDITPDSATINIYNYRSHENGNVPSNSILYIDNLKFDGFLANSDMILSETAETSLIERITVYPNPASSFINFNAIFKKNLNERFTLSIFDINGKQVGKTETRNIQDNVINHQFDISNLKIGVYLIVVNLPTSNTYQAYKFVKIN